MSHHRPAFTRVELLVVIVLSWMLAILLLPAIHRIREELARSHSQSNVEQARPTQRSSPSDHNHLPGGSSLAIGLKPEELEQSLVMHLLEEGMAATAHKGPPQRSVK
jgi:hypothetical protein